MIFITYQQYGGIIFAVTCFAMLVFNIWFLKHQRQKHINAVRGVKIERGRKAMNRNQSFVKQVTGYAFIPSDTLDHYGEILQLTRDKKPKPEPVKPLYETDDHGFVIRSSIKTDDYYDSYYCPYCGNTVNTVISEVPHTTRKTDFYYCESCNVVMTEVDDGVSINNE